MQIKDTINILLLSSQEICKKEFKLHIMIFLIVQIVTRAFLFRDYFTNPRLNKTWIYFSFLPIDKYEYKITVQINNSKWGIARFKRSYYH